MKNYFLSRLKIPQKLPKEMQAKVNEIRQSSNQKQCLRKVYEIMTGKYRGYRFKTYLKLFQIFTSDVQKLWNKNDFLHCHNLNYLTRILLVKSGFFKNSDIKNRWTLVWYISPHQYLEIKLNNNQRVNLDVWGAAYGIQFGDYARGFH